MLSWHVKKQTQKGLYGAKPFSVDSRETRNVMSGAS